MDTWLIWLLSIAGGAFALYYLPRLAIILFTGRDPGGDEDEGLVVFAESIRWMNIRWGMSTCAAGLRRAGYRGAFRYWRWHSWWRGWLVLPALADGKLHEREAGRLADYLTHQRRAHPDRPIYLFGYSAGGYIAARAMELLPDEVKVDGVCLMSAAFNPRRDLRPAARHVRGRIIVIASLIDVVMFLGTLLFGTCDRVFSPSVGAVGYRGPDLPGLMQIRWRPSRMRLGWFGDHFTVSYPSLIAKLVAPRLGIGPRQSPAPA